jgi:hypothetical protein
LVPFTNVNSNNLPRRNTGNGFFNVFHTLSKEGTGV